MESGVHVHVWPISPVLLSLVTLTSVETLICCRQSRLSVCARNMMHNVLNSLQETSFYYIAQFYSFVLCWNAVVEISLPMTNWIISIGVECICEQLCVWHLEWNCDILLFLDNSLECVSCFYESSFTNFMFLVYYVHSVDVFWRLALKYSSRVYLHIFNYCSLGERKSFLSLNYRKCTNLLTMTVFLCKDNILVSHTFFVLLVPLGKHSLQSAWSGTLG